MTLARDVGLTTPLGEAIMWDTMIQHGRGGENGTTAIIEETRTAMGGDVDGNEAPWRGAFLDARLHTWATPTATAPTPTHPRPPGSRRSRP
jgi:hypothetical protein